ncbi:MAG: hypothetical protein QOH04_2889 [Sphingomonadales bacterium]|nr:hypothetical protein [Sphingomonadales bacterium]
MRNLVLAAGLLALAAPAAAQPRPHHPAPYPPPRPRIEDRLPRPYEVERIGTMIERVTDALLDVDVGPVADAIDPYRRYEPRRPETLGELATRRDPYARRRLHNEIEDTSAGLGAATSELAAMTPLLRAEIANTARRIDDAVRESRIRRDRDYERDYRDEEPRGR